MRHGVASCHGSPPTVASASRCDVRGFGKYFYCSVIVIGCEGWSTGAPARASAGLLRLADRVVGRRCGGALCSAFRQDPQGRSARGGPPYAWSISQCRAAFFCGAATLCVVLPSCSTAEGWRSPSATYFTFGVPPFCCAALAAGNSPAPYGRLVSGNPTLLRSCGLDSAGQCTAEP
jgi:hypothetical protein